MSEQVELRHTYFLFFFFVFVKYTIFLLVGVVDGA